MDFGELSRSACPAVLLAVLDEPGTTLCVVVAPTWGMLQPHRAALSGW